MRRAVLAAAVVAGLAAAILVASLEWAPRSHPPTTADLIVQVAVLLTAAVLVVTRATGKR